jgi:sarcosine oxidase
MGSAYDVVIIGGGVIGSATAYFLASEPAFDGRVLVVERDPSYAQAPSARATGGIRQQFSTPENVRIGLFGAGFVKRAHELLEVDGASPDLGFREQGYLLLATPEQLPVMQANHAVQLANGADIVFLDRAELSGRYPWLGCAQLAGGFLGRQNEGWLDPYALLMALRRKAQSLGVTYVADEAVELRLHGRRVAAVRLRDAGWIGVGTVVDAAGARDAARIAALAGVALPVEPRKRTAFVFDCRTRVDARSLTILPNGIAFRPEGQGFLGNAAPPPERDPATDDHEPDHTLFEEVLWPGLADWVSAFEAIKPTTVWACHYDFNTLDENAIIGPPPEPENFLIAAGFSGHGLQQAPAVGRALAELITFGGYRTLDLARLGYQRVLAGDPLRETNCY